MSRPPQDISTYIANETDATVYNAGFGGSTMAQHRSAIWNAFSMYRLADAITSNDFSIQEAAFENDKWNELPDYFKETLEVLKTIDFNEVDIITIGHGLNDFTSSHLIDDVDNPLSTSSIAGALRYSIEKISTVYPNIEIVVCTPTYRLWLDENNNFLYDSNTHIRNGYKLTDVCETTKNIASQYNLHCIDNYNGPGINESNYTLYFPLTDGTHHNSIGRKTIAEHMSKELYKYFG